MRPAIALIVLSLFAFPIKAQQQSEQKPPAPQTMIVECRDMAATGEYLAPDEVIIDGQACRPASTPTQASGVKSAPKPATVAITPPPQAGKVPATSAPVTQAPTGPAPVSAQKEAPSASSGPVAYVKCGVGGTEVYLLRSPTVSSVGSVTVESTLKCGDRLVLVSEEQGWYKVRTGDGTEGYISHYFIEDSPEKAPTVVANSPATSPTIVPQPETPRPVMANLNGFQYTITFVMIQNGQVVHLMPNWAINWVKKNKKHYPSVRFSTSEAPIPGAKNFVIAFSASSGEVQGFDPVTHTDTSTSTSPVSGSGTVTDNEGEMWNYTYDGTVTTTTTTTTEEQVPYTQTSNTLYVTAFNDEGQMISQRWHVFSSRTGGNAYNSLGYNLGSALSAINARGHLLKKVVDDVVPRK